MKIKSLILILMLGLFSFAVMAKVNYKPDKTKAGIETAMSFDCVKTVALEVANKFDFSYNKFVMSNNEFIYIKNTKNQISKLNQNIGTYNARYIGEIPISKIRFNKLATKYKSKEPVSKYRQSINTIKIDLI